LHGNRQLPSPDVDEGITPVAEAVAAGAAEFETKLASFVKENRLYGAVAGVVHGAELAWSGAAGFADAAAGRRASVEDLFRIASITKTFTGTAIMQLRDAGALDLDDPAVRYLPELGLSASQDGISGVTIRRLLSHESGLVSQPPGTDFMAAEPTYEGLPERTLARAAEIFTAIPPHRQPKYSNLGYQLLGEIVQRVSQTPYPQYIARHILEPLGLTSTGFDPLDHALAGRCATGYSGRTFTDELSPAPSMPPIWAEGGLWSCVGDLGRWLAFQLSAYADEPGRSAVLAASTLKEMHKPRYLGDEEWSYAIGITWMAERKDGVTWIQHSGGLPGFTSLACFDRKSRTGGIALVNGEGQAGTLAMALASMARKIVEDQPPADLSLPAATPADIAPLLGLYAPPNLSWQTKVEWRDGKLTIIDGDGPSDQVQLDRGAEPGSFVAVPGSQLAGESVVFNVRPDGTVASVRLGHGTLLRLEPASTGPDSTEPASTGPDSTRQAG
jgi:CubicO group peptidase (beta-lactamase class C family)